MLKLQAKDIYLSALERKDCKKLYEDFEYDFDNPYESLNIGYSMEGSDKWFEEIQALQGKQNVRLGIFLNDNTVIGDVALQDIEMLNRSCTIGMGIAKIENRSKGYGKQALKLILNYAFNSFGLERVSADTLQDNIKAQKSLEKSGFVFEGKERQAVYLNGKKMDRLHYAILKNEFVKN